MAKKLVILLFLKIGDPIFSKEKSNLFPIVRGIQDFRVNF